MSLPIWPPGPMLLPRGFLYLVPCSFQDALLPGEVPVQRGLCPGGSKSGRPPEYSEERAVHILLEYFLVLYVIIYTYLLNI